MLWLQDIITASPPIGDTVRGIDVFVSQFLIILLPDLSSSEERGLPRSIPYSLANFQILGALSEPVCINERLQPRQGVKPAPDIDELSLQFANDNVKKNRLESRIRIVRSLPGGSILESLFEDETFRYGPLAKSRCHLVLKYTSCDFVMCNPPFYSSAEDVQNSAESKEFDPHAVRPILHT